MRLFVLKSLLEGVCDFVFPWACGLCESSKIASRRGAYCDQCNARLTRKIENSCQRCAAEVGQYVSTSAGCVHCRKSKFRFDSVTCLGMYDEALRKAILSSKWSFSSVGINSLSQLFVQQKGSELTQLAADLVIPIPQSWQSRLTRRFNSASIVADVLSKAIGIRHDPHILRRCRNTRPQKRVPVQQRFKNQKDAFRIRDGHLLRGKTVLIVDDVMTTGATCSEAARILRDNGAAHCHIAILARVLDSSA